jgi:hypothetical protein
MGTGEPVSLASAHAAAVGTSPRTAGPRHLPCWLDGDAGEKKGSVRDEGGGHPRTLRDFPSASCVPRRGAQFSSTSRAACDRVVHRCKRRLANLLPCHAEARPATTSLGSTLERASMTSPSTLPERTKVLGWMTRVGPAFTVVAGIVTTLVTGCDRASAIPPHPTRAASSPVVTKSEPSSSAATTEREPPSAPPPSSIAAPTWAAPAPSLAGTPQGSSRPPVGTGKRIDLHGAPCPTTPYTEDDPCPGYINAKRAGAITP